MAADSQRTRWFTRAFEQLDRWRDARLDIHPALLFALLFGEYHEARIADETSDKESYLIPRDALYTPLKLDCEQVRIPKRSSIKYVIS